MLSEILRAAAPGIRVSDPSRPTGITISSLFPCPYRLYLAEMGRVWSPTLTSQQYYNMNDGWDQEAQTIRRLKAAKVEIIDRQISVDIGESEIPGHPDGAVVLNGTKYIWEHKAFNYRNFEKFSESGLAAFPGYKAQIQGYMLGTGIGCGIFHVKYKDNNDYGDMLVPFDPDYIEQIVEWADRIRLRNWVPTPKECEACTYCYSGCFDIMDMSAIEMADEPEMVEKYTQGDQLEKVGKSMKEEARLFFLGDRESSFGIIQDKKLLSLPGLTIARIDSSRFTVSDKKVLEVFGPDGLLQVSEEKPVVQFRFKVLKGGT